MLTTEIGELLDQGPEKVRELEFTYRNGGKVRGTIRKFSARRGKLIVQKSNPTQGERPRHRVVFDHVVSLRIAFNDGSSRDFT